jgi:hypothetical protein
MAKKLVVVRWVKVKPYPKWWQFWKTTHEQEVVGKIKLVEGSD